MVLAGDDVFTTHAAPVSYPMDPVSGSGHAGTCTVAGTHTGGFRLRAHGQGAPNTLISFNLVDVSTPSLYRTTAIVEVNQHGDFRTGWDVVLPGTFPEGHSVERWLTASSSAILARSMSFQAP